MLCSLRTLGALALATTATALKCVSGQGNFYNGYSGCVGVDSTTVEEDVDCTGSMDACIGLVYEIDQGGGCLYTIANFYCTTSDTSYDCDWYAEEYNSSTREAYTLNDCQMCTSDNCVTLSRVTPYPESGSVDSAAAIRPLLAVVVALGALAGGALLSVL